jgi:hypothetical protein
MYALKQYFGGNFKDGLPKTLSEDSMVVAVVNGRFGVAFIESTPYVLGKSFGQSSVRLSSKAP